jgi:hypothetical protein
MILICFKIKFINVIDTSKYLFVNDWVAKSTLSQTWTSLRSNNILKEHLFYRVNVNFANDFPDCVRKRCFRES